MKKNKRNKLSKESFTLRMDDLKNLEVISDEILYSLDFESLEKFINDTSDIEHFIELKKEELEVRAKPDFNGLRLEKGRSTAADEFYEDIFSIKDDCDKNILLDTIFEAGDEREIPILKQIIVNEDNLGIREKALKILNGITVENYWFSEEEGAVLEIDKIRKRCIFKPLFEIADFNTKLILLEQIAEIGDSKEMIFLDTIDTSNNVILKKKVKRTKIQLAEKLNLKGSNVVLDNNNNNKIGQTNTEESIHFFGTKCLEQKMAIQPIKDFHSIKSKMPLSLTDLLETLKIKESPSSDILNIQFKLDAVKVRDTMTSNDHSKRKPMISTPNSLLMKLASQLKINLCRWIGVKK
ncbi:MAG: hypothetical protein ACI91R_002543 [Vicingaceae bacterium]|jgi:hypothetical protein